MKKNLLKKESAFIKFHNKTDVHNPSNQNKKHSFSLSTKKKKKIKDAPQEVA